jgi:ATP/maltotriose-dependent transcriptional regulator MalT
VLGEEYPEELHDYFAEELFASLPESTRDGLSRLALIPSVTREAAEAILNNSIDEVLADARGAGMFSAQRGVDLTFHPLLRTFLMRKLLEFPRQELDATVARATDFLLQAHSWDEAFSLISDFGRHDLLDTLFGSALIALTREGRLATLREWLDYARSHDLAFPSLDLAEAELAFRQGVHELAEMLADTAARALAFASPLKSAAHFLAGQSSYLLDETALALRHFEDASENARTATDSRNALWGQFLISLELERPDVSERLREFATVGPQDRDTRIRTLNGRLVLAIRKGGLAAAVSDAASAVAAVRDATDPVVRSSFWHIYAVALSLTGKLSIGA